MRRPNLKNPLVAIRVKRGLSVAEFAARLGVPPEMLKKYEAFSRPIPLRVLVKAAEYDGQETIMTRYPQLAIAQAGASTRDTFIAHVLSGLCANPNVFGHNSRTGWGLVNCTETQLVGFAIGLADEALAVRANGGAA